MTGGWFIRKKAAVEYLNHMCARDIGPKCIVPHELFELCHLVALLELWDLRTRALVLWANFGILGAIDCGHGSLPFNCTMYD